MGAQRDTVARQIRPDLGVHGGVGEEGERDPTLPRTLLVERQELLEQALPRLAGPPAAPLIRACTRAPTRSSAAAVGVWGLTFALGMLAGVTVHPHVVGEDGLRLRSGRAVDVVVPWAAIERARAVRPGPAGARRDGLSPR